MNEQCICFGKSALVIGVWSNKFSVWKRKYMQITGVSFQMRREFHSNLFLNRHWTSLVILSKTSFLTWCISTLSVCTKYQTCENLNSIGHWSCEIIMEEKHPYHTKLCVFRCLISEPQNLILRSQNQICGKLPLSWKLCHFRGSRFSQCVILSTALPCWFQVSFYAKTNLNNYF